MTLFTPLRPDTVHALSPLFQVSCGFVTDLAWSPDGDMLAVAHGAGIWLYEGGFSAQPSLVLPEHTAPVKSITFNPTGLVMVSGSADTTVRLWLTSRARSFYIYRGHSGGVNAVAVSPCGRLLASAGGDREIRLFDMKESAASNVLRGHTHEITSLAFGLGGRVLISGSWDKTARLWSLDETWRCPQPVLEHRDWVRALAVSPDGHTLAVACKDSLIAFWHLESCALICSFPAHEGGVDSLAFSPDGALLASGGRDHAIKFWDAEKLSKSGESALIHRLDRHQKPVLALAFSPNGALLVSGSGDNTVCLWGVRAD